ncbi:MAG: hypothetical protein V3V23_05700 [Dehalococcoidales bacterium]
MLTVSDGAKKELKKLLSASVDMPQARLRIVDRGQGELGLDLDIEMPGDEVVEHEGSGVLVVEHGLATSLGGVILDVEKAVQGTELVICGKAKIAS